MEKTNDEGEVKNVEIPQTLLQEIRNEMATLRSDNAMLKEVADKRSMAAYQARHKEKLASEVSLRTLIHEDKEKIVIGWSNMLVNEVHKDIVTQKWTEKQEVEIELEDKTKLRLSYMAWQRDYKKVLCKVLSHSTDEATGNVTVRLQRMDNSKKYEVDLRFVN